MSMNTLPVRRADSIAVSKALCMLGLPLVHIIETIADNAFLDTSVIDITGLVALTVLGPAVFMITMGIEQGRGGSTKQFLRLGVQMIFIGIILNVLRDIIPFAIYGIISPGSISFDVAVGYLLESDIYFFVGLFMLFYALMKKLGISLFGILMITLVMLAVNTVFVYSGAVITDNPFLVQLLGNFIYVGPTSCFPLLSWAVVPVIGICFTARYTVNWQARMPASKLAVASGICLGVFILTMMCFNLDVRAIAVSPSNAYMTDLFNLVIQILVTFFVIGFIQIILNHKKPGPVERFFGRISDYLMPYYFISWIFVAVALLILGYVYSTDTPMNAVVVLLVSAAVTVVSLAVSVKSGMKIMRFLLLITDFGRLKRKRRRRGTV